MRASESIDQLAAALVDALAEMRNLPQDSSATIATKKGGEFSFRFVSLAEMLDAVRPVLVLHGLALMQEVASLESGPTASTILMHSSGQWLQFGDVAVPLPADPLPRDVSGNATTARRISLMAALGITGENEDGTSPPGRRPPQRGARRDEPQRATSRQLAKISAEQERARVSDDTLARDLRGRYRVETTGELSSEQASELIKRLMAEADRRIAARAAGADPATGEVRTPQAQGDDDEDDVPGMDASEAREMWGRS